MKEITQQEAQDLKDTHLSFSPGNILYETKKAYSVKMWSPSHQTVTSFWIPKSKLKCTCVVTELGKVTTYYVPKYFIK